MVESGTSVVVYGCLVVLLGFLVVVGLVISSSCIISAVTGLLVLGIVDLLVEVLTVVFKVVVR